MIKETHNIAGKDTLNPPKNLNGLEIQLVFDKDRQSTAVGQQSLEWIEDEAEQLITWFNNGLTGGVGVLECPEHTVTYEDGENKIVFNQIIDLTSASFNSSPIGVNADSIPQQELDWLEAVADGVSFERLAFENKIVKDDYVIAPYIISTVPDYRDAFIVTLTFATVTIELRSVIADIQGMIGEAATFFDSIGAIIRFAAKIIYLIGLLVTLVELILDLFTLIIQKVKYMAGMKVNRIIEIACDDLGLEYQSPVLEAAPLNRLVYFPPPQSYPDSVEDSRIKGYLTPNRAKDELTGYPKTTFGQFLRDISNVFNLRRQVFDGKLTLLPFDFVPSGASFQLPDNEQNEFRTNASELFSSIFLSFQTDNNDRNTIQNYKGTDVDVSLRPIRVNKKENLLFQNGLVNIFPFARTIRKTRLTTPEVIADALLTVTDVLLNGLIGVVNTLTSLVNGVLRLIGTVKKILKFFGVKTNTSSPKIGRIKKPNLSDLIDNRIGMISLENDFFSIGKLALMDVSSNPKNTKVSTDNATVLDALNIYNTYHSLTNTQKLIRTFVNIEMTLADVLNLRREGAVKLPNGNIARVRSATWKGEPTGGIAQMEVEEFTLYTNNLQEIIRQTNGR